MEMQLEIRLGKIGLIRIPVNPEGDRLVSGLGTCEPLDPSLTQADVLGCAGLAFSEWLDLLDRAFDFDELDVPPDPNAGLHSVEDPDSGAEGVFDEEDPTDERVKGAQEIFLGKPREEAGVHPAQDPDQKSDKDPPAPTVQETEGNP